MGRVLLMPGVTQPEEPTMPTPAARQFVRVKRGQVSSALFDLVVTRIARMSSRFGGEAQALVDTVWRLYAENAPILGLWVAIENGQLVGHVLGMASQWDGRMVAWVNQAEMDEGHSHPYFIEEQLTALDAWVHEMNAWYAEQKAHVVIREEMMQTPWIERAKAWARGFGFEPYRLICRREVHV